jgi:hypothetical protein
MNPLPPISSKFWPRLMFLVSLMMGCAVVAKTRVEVLSSREQAHGELEARIRDRSRADRIEATWNPGHLVPMTEDVFSGVPDALVRPTPVDPVLARPAVPPPQTITTSWPSGPMLNALATPHGKEEPTDWLDRHFATVELARNYTR